MGRIRKFIKSKADALLRLQVEVRQLTGFAAIAIACLMFMEFMLKITMGLRPSLGDDARLVEYITNHAVEILIVIIIDTFLMAFLIIFFAGLRQLIIKSNKDLGWIADLAFGAGLVFVAITLVGDSMDAGSALNTIGGYGADSSVLRALTEGHMLLFGSIGCILIALIISAFSYATFATNAVPKWTGWVGYGVAVLNLLSILTVFGGTNASSFFSAGGTGVTLIATFPFLAWVIIVGIVTVRKQPN